MPRPLRQKTTRESFAHTLRYYRVKKEWSQALLAKKAGVSQQQISAWEKGRLWIQPEMLDRLARVLGVGVDELFVDKRRKRRCVFRDEDES